MVITVDDVKVVGLVGPIVAGLFTLVRLFERIRRKKFGVDDAWAALSLAVLIVFEVALFIHLGNPTHLSPTSRVAMYYIMAQGFYAIIWPARISIVFSVVRFTPQSSKLKNTLYCAAISFLILWSILFAQIFWVCQRMPKWQDDMSPQCPLGSDVAIAQLISDIYADSVLIAAPLRLLWNLDVPRSQRNRLLVVFTSSIGTTAASLVHAYYILRQGGLPVVFAAIIEQCVSLLVCNLAVIAGLISHLIYSSKCHFSHDTGSQNILGGSNHTISMINSFNNGHGAIDIKSHRTDLEAGTPLQILKVVEVHTETDSISHKDGTKL